MGSDRILWINDLRGGRNDTDPPSLIRDNQVTEALNVDWKDATVARKRGGSISLATTGGTAVGSGVGAMFRFVPGNDETAAQMFTMDGNTVVHRLNAGTSWADVTTDDAPISSFNDGVYAATLNGKLFIAYNGTGGTPDRMHVYDPNLSSPRIRRVGIDPGTNAPTCANNATAGAYPATLRYYRIRWTQVSGSTVIRRSEPTPSVSFTPSGAKIGVDITRPTAPGEGETHYEVEVSLDNITFYTLFGVGGGVAAIAIGTTVSTDSTTTTTYSTYAVSALAGTYGLFPSVKYLLTDGNRLLGAGAYRSNGATSGGKNSRVWFTPVLGSLDAGDDERIPNQVNQKNWVDLNENDGGAITGLGGPINGVPWAFKYRQVWKLRPTGDVNTPYLPRKVRDDIGCVAGKSVAIGEDHAGRAAIYFLSHRGPYRINLDGDVEFLGRDNEVMWRSVNLGAAVVAHSVFYPDLHQWWLWITTGANTTPDTKMIFDVQRGFPDEDGQIRGGWAKHTGPSAVAACSCLYSNTVGATMSRDLKPYVGKTDNTIFKCDTSDLTDNGTNYQAYVIPKALRARPGMMMGLQFPLVLAKAQSATSLALTLIKDFGTETYPASTASIAASGSETRVFSDWDVSMSNATVIQAQVGDSAAAATTWAIDELMFTISEQEPQ